MVHLAATAVAAALAVSSVLSVSGVHLENAEPTVMVVLLVRNKEPYLPYTLTRLSELGYPKERLSPRIRSDHNQDRSAQVLHAWLDRYGPSYSHVDVVLNTTSPPLRADETSATDLSPSRYRAVIGMKEEALMAARRFKTDFVWFLDADVVLHDSSILRQLLAMEKPLLAPMLRTGGNYSNFWSAMSEDFSLEEERGQYQAIYEREKRGCFAVPLIRSCVLVDLREGPADELTFVRAKMSTPTGPELDDTITLALSVRQAHLEMHVCNQKDFGQIPIPVEPSEEISKEWANILNIKLEALVDWPPLAVSPVLRPFLPPPPKKSWLGFDRVYSIGLVRRSERWDSLLATFDELGIDTDQVNAVDGRDLTEEFLDKRNITMLKDPDRGLSIHLNMGEVGCFLSHYAVWTNVLESGYERVIVLENDGRATAEFKQRLAQLREEADRLRPDWEFIYLHRTLPDNDNDRPVEGAELLIRPGFCYSSVAYMLTSRGAEKLVAGRPLQNLMCVDDYLPLMAGNNPRLRWLDRYPGAGSMKTFSSRENLIDQYKNAGDSGYVSDTTVDTVGAESCADKGSSNEDSCSGQPA